MIEVTHREQWEQRLQGSQRVSIPGFEGSVTTAANTSKLVDRLPYCWAPPDARGTPNVERACQSRRLFNNNYDFLCLLHTEGHLSARRGRQFVACS